MLAEDLNRIEQELNIELPPFYKETMANYPFQDDSFASEFSLTNSADHIISLNSLFGEEERKFAIGSDGGEFTFYIKLDGYETVYIDDLEKSDMHDSIQAANWQEYLNQIEIEIKAFQEEERKRAERKANKKWWQFWI